MIKFNIYSYNKKKLNSYKIGMEMNFINLIDKGLLPKAYTNIMFNDKMLKIFPLDLKQGDGSFHHHFFSVEVMTAW